MTLPLPLPLAVVLSIAGFSATFGFALRVVAFYLPGRHRARRAQRPAMRSWTPPIGPIAVHRAVGGVR